MRGVPPRGTPGARGVQARLRRVPRALRAVRGRVRATRYRGNAPGRRRTRPARVAALRRCGRRLRCRRRRVRRRRRRRRRRPRWGRGGPGSRGRRCVGPARGCLVREAADRAHHGARGAPRRARQGHGRAPECALRRAQAPGERGAFPGVSGFRRGGAAFGNERSVHVGADRAPRARGVAGGLADAFSVQRRALAFGSRGRRRDERGVSEGASLRQRQELRVCAARPRGARRDVRRAPPPELPGRARNSRGSLLCFSERSRSKRERTSARRVRRSVRVVRRRGGGDAFRERNRRRGGRRARALRVRAQARHVRAVRVPERDSRCGQQTGVPHRFERRGRRAPNARKGRRARGDRAFGDGGGARRRRVALRDVARRARSVRGCVLRISHHRRGCRCGGAARGSGPRAEARLEAFSAVSLRVALDVRKRYK
mmetsp:Transcript_3822/g.16220  ORF Transcript_3822/g.16220 Transcript_3822/m.16220 type:complete len:429 (-) Transcript_3822:220-1506(-)